MNVVHSELYTRASCSAIPEPKELKAPDPKQEEGEAAIAKHLMTPSYEAEEENERRMKAAIQRVVDNDSILGALKRLEKGRNHEFEGLKTSGRLS